MPGVEESDNAAALIRETFVHSAETHAEIGSTNDRAIELCRRGVDDLPMLVLAKRQTAGRGRGAAKWWAGDGALLFSLILDAEAISSAAENRLSVVPLAMASAVAAAVGPFIPAAGEPPWVKWPNDVYVGQQKLAGVLAEAPALTGAGRLVVGVGVNLNNSAAEAPRELRNRVAAIVDLRRAPLTNAERQKLTHDVLKHFASNLQDLSRGFNLPDCPLSSRAVRVDTPTGVLRGEYAGVDNAGALILRTGGRLERVVSGSELRLDDSLDVQTS